jgi:hypothetical protein
MQSPGSTRSREVVADLVVIVGAMPRRAQWSSQAVREAAAAQHGLITAAQLAALGVPRSTIVRSIELGGMFSWVLPGVHRVDAAGALAPDQRCAAALLYAGPDAALGGVSSLERLSVPAPLLGPLDPLDRVHVVIPHARRRASHLFVQVERSVLPFVPWEAGGFPVTPAARSVIDACRRCPDEAAVRGLVLGVVQRGVTTVEALQLEHRRGQIRGSRFVRLAIEEAAAGIASPPEGDIRRALLNAGWTRLMFNVDLELLDGRFLARPDVYDPVTGTCLEVDSRAYHFGVEKWEATMERHARMTAAGLAVLHAPPSRLEHRTDEVLSEFAAAVREREGRPAPRVRVRTMNGLRAG